jgi:hypothetical protein
MSTTEPTKPDHVAATRSELESTLDAIGDKLNVQKQTGVLVDKAKSSYDANPIPWIVGATAAVVVLGGLVAWALLTNDD